MKGASLGVLLAAVALTGAWGFSPPAAAQRAVASPDGGSSLVAVPGVATGDGQLWMVSDPRLRALAVYRVETATGRIKLLAVRNVQWDLQMMQHNSDNPQPQEIRTLLEQR